jgi:hypothetical protein
MKILITQSGNKYYICNDRKYDISYPKEWAESHKKHPNGKGSGPKECGNCCFYGSINGVFVYHCFNCAYLYGTNNWISPKKVTKRDLEKIPYLKHITKLSDIGFPKLNYNKIKILFYQY